MSLSCLARLWVRARRWLTVAILRNRCRKLFVLGCFLVLTFFVLRLPEPQTVSVLTAQTEGLSYRVIRPELSAIAIDRLRLLSLQPGVDAQADCFTGLVKPALNAVVTYRKTRAGELAVVIEPGDGLTTLELKADKDGKVELRQFEQPIVVAKGSCPGTSLVRLPLWGPARFGEEIRSLAGEPDEQPALMSDGEIKVFGRSWGLARLAGEIFSPILPTRWTEWLRGERDVSKPAPTLYPAADLPIPTGSRLEEGSDAGELRGAPWWGVVRVKDDGLQVDATTEARNLLIFLPGSALGGDSLAIGRFVQLTKDPTLFAFQIYFVILTFFLKNLSSHVTRFIRRGRRRRHARSRPVVGSFEG